MYGVVFLRRSNANRFKICGKKYSTGNRAYVNLENINLLWNSKNLKQYGIRHEIGCCLIFVLFSDNLALQDNSRYIPVRPIVRRNLLSESTGTESGEQHNTTVGVVIPTTPNSALQTFRLNDATGATSVGINNLINNTGSQKHVLNPFQQQQLQQQQQHQQQLRASPLSSRVPDGASQNQLNLNKNSNQQQQQLQQQQQQFYGVGAVGGTTASKVNVEDKLNQIQEYIKLTTNLISSVQIDNVSIFHFPYLRYLWTSSRFRVIHRGGNRRREGNKTTPLPGWVIRVAISCRSIPLV